MADRPAVLAGPLPEFGYGDCCLAVALLIPIMYALLLAFVSLNPLMKKYGLLWLVCLSAIFCQIPGSFFDKLWHVLKIVVFFAVLLFSWRAHC